MRSLEEVIADARGEAAVLRSNRASFSVDRVEAILEEVAAAAEEYITWLSESDASIRAGRSETWLRARFPSMERDGNARTSGRARQYRQCAVPRRANVVAAASRAREAARQEKRSA